jgi:hypothetical protein
MIIWITGTRIKKPQLIAVAYALNNGQKVVVNLLLVTTLIRHNLAPSYKVT